MGKIHSHDSTFYLVFPQSGNGHNYSTLSLDQELSRFYEMEIVEIKKWYGDMPLWSLTKTGFNVLNDLWPKVREKLQAVCFD